MASTQKAVPQALPSKKLILALTVLYLLAELFYLITILGNLPILKDTISLGRFDDFNVFFNQNFVIFDIASSITMFLCFCTLGITIKINGFPSLFTYIAVFWSTLFNAVASYYIYYTMQHNIYMKLEQLALILPIVVIFLSSTFLIDDLGDLFRGTYHIYYTRKQRRFLNLRKLENVEEKVEEHLERVKNPKEEVVDVVRAHSIDITGAAEMAIPELKK